MELRHRHVKPGIHLVGVVGEMDMYNSHELKELVTKLLGSGTDPLILDLGGLKYVDSSGVSVLIYVFTQARKASIPVWFANVHGTVRKVIELTSLLNFFPIAENLEEAYKQAVKTRGV